MIQSVFQPDDTPIVKLENITKRFRTSRGDLLACNDITVQVDKGISLGVVGESGSGKSTLIKTLQLLERPTKGNVWIGGQNVTLYSEKRLKPFRRRIQFVAQDPYSSLFPNMTIAQNISEPLYVHGISDKKERRDKAAELMELVGISLSYFHSFPHELSGGQQQRVAIARALALSPEVLVLDEAVSSLDVSIQAQILNLLQRLKKDLGLTYIFISHNLAVIRLMCEQLAVMYLGRVVEQGNSDEVFRNPLHPYTRSLIAAIPAFTNNGVTPLPSESLLGGNRPSATDLPKGCAYQTRCPFATEICFREEPKLEAMGNGSLVACHNAMSASDNA